MPKKALPPTQSDIDEVTREAVILVQQLGLQQDGEAAHKTAGRKHILLANLSLFSLIILNADPFIEGWKR